MKWHKTDEGNYLSTNADAGIWRIEPIEYDSGRKGWRLTKYGRHFAYAKTLATAKARAANYYSSLVGESRRRSARSNPQRNPIMRKSTEKTVVVVGGVAAAAALAYYLYKKNHPTTATPAVPAAPAVPAVTP